MGFEAMLCMQQVFLTALYALDALHVLYALYALFSGSKPCYVRSKCF